MTANIVGIEFGIQMCAHEKSMTTDGITRKSFC